MTGISKSVFALVAAFIAAPAFAGGIYDSLSPAEQARIQKGEQVFKTEETGAAWPKAFLFQRIQATPEEAMAFFSDIELQKSYVPNLLKSKISKWTSKNVVVADYTLKVPVLSDENYTVADTLSSYDNGASYRVDWTLVRADSVKATTGYAKFESLGTGTILAYYNYVIPGSSMAGLVKNKAMQQVKDTGNAIVKAIEKTRVENNALLQKQIEALRAILK